MTRQIVPDGSTLVITQHTWHREPLFSRAENVDLLQDRLALCKGKYPYELHAWVVLPDHFHLLVEPAAGVVVGSLMHCVKAMFTKEYRRREGLPKDAQVWQKGYGAHGIEAAADFGRAIDFIHLNPVHHGLSQAPGEWEWSSFKEWQRDGRYEDGWGAPPLEPWVLEMSATLEEGQSG